MSAVGRLLAGLVAVGTFACFHPYTSVRFIPTSGSPVPQSRRSAAEIEIFSAGPPQRTYVERGMIESLSHGEDAARGIAKMRHLAAMVGCDALVIRTRLHTGYARAARPTGGYDATCIVYTSPRERSH